MSRRASDATDDNERRPPRRARESWALQHPWLTTAITLTGIGAVVQIAELLLSPSRAARAPRPFPPPPPPPPPPPAEKK